MLNRPSFFGHILRRLFTPPKGRALDISAARLSLLASGLIFTIGCTASGENAIETSLEKDFQLRVGQSAFISPENIEIAFVTVTSDSRCGKGEVCIWEGDAIVRIQLQREGEETVELDLHTASRESDAVDFADHSIRLVAVFPPAVFGHVISPNEYVAVLRVVRGRSGEQNYY